MPAPAPPRWLSPAIVLACVVLLGCEVVVAVATPPDIVESTYVLQALEIGRGLTLYADPRDGATAWAHPPIYYALLGGAHRLVGGDPVLVGRTLNLAIHVLECALVVWLGRRAPPVATATTVLWSLAMTAVLGSVVSSARANTLACSLALASALIFLRGLERGRAGLVVLGVLAAWLATATKQTLAWLGPFYVACALAKGRSLLPALASNVLGVLVAAGIVAAFGSHGWFYLWTLPAVQPRTLVMLLCNLTAAGPVVAGSIVYVLAIALHRGPAGAREAARDPALHLSFAALATGAFFSSKVGARPDAYLPLVFLTVPWLLSPGTAAPGFRERFVERRPFTLPLCGAILGLVSATTGAREALDARTAWRAWVEGLDRAIAQVATPGDRVFCTNPILNLDRGEFLPLGYEASLDATAAGADAVAGYVRRLEALRPDVVVVHEAPEYRDGYGPLVRALEERRFTLHASSPSEKPAAGYSRPGFRIYRATRPR